MQPNYTIDDIFNPTSPFFIGGYFPAPAPSAQNAFGDQIDPRTIGAGEMIRQLIVQDGYLRSGNFVSGVSGWQINADGDVEFNNGTFRGTISASTIDIGGSDATSFHVDVDGNMWLGAATYAAAPFKVSKAGVLSATKRVVTVTQSATPAIDTDVTDVASITGLAQDITSMTTNLTGTPTAGQLISIQITDDGTSRAITWGAKFASTLVALPTNTTISTLLRVGFQWNTVTSKWDCIALA